MAAAFRVAYHLDGNRVPFNHIGALIPERPAHFLMNPYGIGWDEITAFDLVAADLDGKLVSHTGATRAPAGFKNGGRRLTLGSGGYRKTCSIYASPRCAT